MKVNKKTPVKTTAVIMASIIALTSFATLGAGAVSSRPGNEPVPANTGISFEFRQNPVEDNAEVTFADLKDAEAAIEKLYNNNYTEIAEKIREMRGGYPEYTDEQLTLYYGSCGPTSIAFQKVLIDNSIYAETRVDSRMYSAHEYNLLRTRFTDGTVKFIILDGSYRQFMRDYFRNEIIKNTGKPQGEVSDNEIDDAILSSGLPNILIYEYGNQEEAKKIITDVLGTDIDQSAYNWMDHAHESQPYPEPGIQMIRTRYLTDQDIERLNTGIPYNKPFTDDLYIKGSWSDFSERERFSYKGNGVYEVNLSFDQAANEGIYEFKVEGAADGTFQFGTINDEALNPILNYSYNHYTRQIFLTNNQSVSQNIKLDTSSSQNITIRIDTRAGIDTPFIRAIPSDKIGVYGDVNRDEEIDMEDVITMQKALAGLVTLTPNQLLLCDVMNNDNFSVEDIILVQKYIARDTNTGRTGSPAYIPVEF